MGLRDGFSLKMQEIGIKGKMGTTVRYKSDVLAPHYGEVGVFAYALKASCCFLHRRIPTEDLFLLIS